MTQDILKYFIASRSPLWTLIFTLPTEAWHYQLIEASTWQNVLTTSFNGILFLLGGYWTRQGGFSSVRMAACWFSAWRSIGPKWFEWWKFGERRLSAMKDGQEWREKFKLLQLFQHCSCNTLNSCKHLMHLELQYPQGGECHRVKYLLRSLLFGYTIQTEV